MSGDQEEVFSANPAPPSGAERVRQAAAKETGPEEDLWKGSYSPKALIGNCIILAVISLAGLIVAGLFFAVPPVAISIFIALPILWLLHALYLGYRRLSIHYRLTTHRLFHEHGLLRRTTDRIEVIDMDDITSTQGLFERMVGVGTIRIKSSDRSHPDISLPGIENVRKVAEMMDELRRKERIRRGLHITST